MNRGAWWATVHGVTKNWTGLKRLSMYTTSQLRGLQPHASGRLLRSQPAGLMFSWRGQAPAGRSCWVQPLLIGALSQAGGPVTSHMHLSQPLTSRWPKGNGMGLMSALSRGRGLLWAEGVMCISAREATVH